MPEGQKKSKIASVGKAGFKLSGKMGLGSSAWALSVLAIFVPVVGVFAMWPAMIMAIIHGLMGGVLFPILVAVTTIINRFFFSLVSLGLFSKIITLLLFVGIIFAVKFAIQEKFKDD